MKLTVFWCENHFSMSSFILSHGSASVFEIRGPGQAQMLTQLSPRKFWGRVGQAEWCDKIQICLFNNYNQLLVLSHIWRNNLHLYTKFGPNRSQKYNNFLKKGNRTPEDFNDWKKHANCGKTGAWGLRRWPMWTFATNIFLFRTSRHLTDIN